MRKHYQMKCDYCGKFASSLHDVWTHVPYPSIDAEACDTCFASRSGCHPRKERPMTNHLHYIEHRHEAGYGIKTIFTCKGDRTSPCHQYPPAELEMEAWSDEDKQMFVSHDECTWEQWANLECAQLCGPDDAPVRGGPEPVRVWFEECMIWEYVNDETRETQ